MTRPAMWRAVSALLAVAWVLWGVVAVAQTTDCRIVGCPAPAACQGQGVCNTNNGKCSYPNLPNGTLCDDGSLCTTNDACNGGQCRGTAVVCDSPGTCETGPGSCTLRTGACVYPPKADGTGCDDGNACTQTDTCQGGACTGSNPVTCTASDQCHLAGTCDPSSGNCSNPEAPDTTSCNDGNACTQTDTCQAGACTGSNPVTCTALDQCHVAGTCDPANGSCSNPAAPDTTPCNDGNVCTATDTCESGACTGSNPVTCSPPDQCHAAGVCDPIAGCGYAALADGTPCSDSNSCTTGETCQGGTCSGGTAVVCTAQDSCHLSGTCDPQTGTCSNPQAPDGTECNDGDVCTTGDVCTGGVCQGPGGPPVPEVTRTMGFYMVHEAALQACLDGGKITLGGVEVDSLSYALGLLWARPGTCEDGTARSERDRDWLLLARQALVAICNQRNFGATPDSTLMSSVISTLGGDDCGAMGSLETQLDAFNRSGDSLPLPSGFDAGPATPVHARSIADDPTANSHETCTPGGM